MNKMPLFQNDCKCWSEKKKKYPKKKQNIVFLVRYMSNIKMENFC